MEVHAGFLSLVPPVFAIVLALWKKRVLPALFLGIVTAQVVLGLEQPGRIPFRTLDHMVGIAGEPGNLRLIVFSFLIGGLLRLIRDVGGFEAFAATIEHHRIRIDRRSAFGTTWLLGASLFLEAWSNVLINGTTVAPLYDRLGISRQRMAYFIHTIGVAVVAMVPVNGWAAFYMGLLIAQGVDEPFRFLLESIPFMLYSWISLALVLYVMVSNLTIGPIRRFDEAAKAAASERTSDDSHAVASNEQGGHGQRLMFMLVPILTLVVVVFASLYLTGNGDITRGDGSKSVLYAVASGVLVAAVLLIATGRMGFLEVEEKLVDGMQSFFSVGILIVFALSLGDLCQQLGTGNYVASLVGEKLPGALLPALIFGLGAAMSFATGTSYGTFSIMVPIALPIAGPAGIDPALMFGAVIAGGLFGDNCSPISDTTIVTSIGAGVEIIDHVRTQLPYALISGSLTIAGFLLLGVLR